MTSNDHIQGRCWACNAPGPEGTERNFLCGQCAHPEEVRSYCAGCRRRRSYSRTELELLCQTYDINQPIEPGIVIVLTHCAHCHQAPAPQRVEFFSITA